MSAISVLSHSLQQRLLAELKPGESLVWTGQPNPRRYMRSAFAIWLFFVPWTAFSLFWIASASGFEWPRFSDGWSFFPLFGVPFLLIGLAGLSSPFYLRRKARWMIYGITTRRALAIEGIKSIKVKSYQASCIVNVERTEHPDGSGDLVLRKESYQDGDGDRQTRDQGFFAIDEVRRVELLIEKLIQANRA